MSIIFFDTETTNLLAVEAAELQHQPYIVEIYCVKTDLFLTPMNHFHTLIKPPIPIPENVIKIHGITDEKVAPCKPFAGHYRALCAFFTGVTHMVGHNLQYDKRMLLYELQRINKQFNFPWPQHNICTVEELQKTRGHRMSLGDIYEELFDQRFDNAHSAEADTIALVNVYKALVQRQMVKGPTT